MQTTKEMAHREGSLEHSAIVKSGSALPYFSLLSSFLTTVDLSYDNLICFPWNTVVFPLLAILAFSKATTCPRSGFRCISA